MILTLLFQLVDAVLNLLRLLGEGLGLLLEHIQLVVLGQAFSRLLRWTRSGGMAAL